MSERPDLERALRIWLDDGPTTMPERVVAVVDERTKRQSQRPSWRIAWRQIAMNSYAKFIVGMAAVLIVAAVGFAGFSLGSNGSGGPEAVASPTADPTPTPSPTPETSAAPTIAPDPPAVSFKGALPAGWSLDSGANWAGTTNVQLSFSTSNDDAWTMLELLPNRFAMAADCTLMPAPGVQTTAKAITETLESRTGLLASGTGPVTIGGLTGRQLDVGIDPSLGPTCTDAEGSRYTPLLGYFAGRDWLYNGLVANEVARIIVLDASNGRNVVLVTSASDRATFDRHIAEAEAIIDALQFDTGG